MRAYLAIFLLLFMLNSCSNDQVGEGTEKKPAQVDLKEALPGTWETVSISVAVQSAENNQDSSYLFEIKEENWNAKLGIKPPKTFFLPENKYRKDHFDLHGNVTSTSKGLWNVFGDTLMLLSSDATYQYLVSVNDNGLAAFKSMVDWDGDGQEDDEYTGIERRVSRSAN